MTNKQKTVMFITGGPRVGKTMFGLQAATLGLVDVFFNAEDFTGTDKEASEYIQGLIKQHDRVALELFDKNVSDSIKLHGKLNNISMSYVNVRLKEPSASTNKWVSDLLMTRTSIPYSEMYKPKENKDTKASTLEEMVTFLQTSVDALNLKHKTLTSTLYEIAKILDNHRTAITVSEINTCLNEIEAELHSITYEDSEDYIAEQQATTTHIGLGVPAFSEKIIEGINVTSTTFNQAAATEMTDELLKGLQNPTPTV